MKQFYISWDTTNPSKETLGDLEKNINNQHLGFNKLEIKQEDKNTIFMTFDYDDTLGGMEVEGNDVMYYFEFHDLKNHVDKEFKQTSWNGIAKFLKEQLKLN